MTGQAGATQDQAIQAAWNVLHDSGLLYFEHEDLGKSAVKQMLVAVAEAQRVEARMRLCGQQAEETHVLFHAFASQKPA